MNQITLSILAHVDAGKTTLSEALLYKSGSIRELGRVDKGNAHLDTDEIEKSRGITVFSKQAVFNTKHTCFTLLDTPGHSDFSSETERTLNVTDYAILVMNAQTPVQSHTITLWNLLKLYKIPVFCFINKTDISFKSKEEIFSDIKEHLKGNFIDFSDIKSDDFEEKLAECDENILEKFTDGNLINDDDIINAIKSRNVVPCVFGSALKLEGVEYFLDILDKYTKMSEYGENFAAKIFKISRDNQGKRLTFMKIYGGSLKVRDTISSGEFSEKVSQIRIYSGDKFSTVDEAPAGTVCAVTGCEHTFTGESIGLENSGLQPVLHPVMAYKIIIQDGINENEAFKQFKILEEEDPELQFLWNESTKEINVRIMGEIQLEILKSLVKRCFGFDIDFDEGKIVYKETIKNKVEAAGHFEPLRHYAEVHFTIEPCDCDGICYESACSVDDLSANWQNLIKTHVFEKKHRGVLTGSEITGIKITLIAGKANIKHTSGGDFRQAVYRAIRCGLRKAESVLLEPYYDFLLSVPSDFTGRAMNDLRLKFAEFSTPQMKNGMTYIQGSAPVSTLQGYVNNLNLYTKGKGSTQLSFSNYRPCHNTSEVIAKIGYDPDADLMNSADSIFCKGGAAVLVKWDEADKYMHIDTGFGKVHTSESSKRVSISDEEMKSILEREFALSKPTQIHSEAKIHGKIDTLDNYKLEEKKQKKDCLLVDGYNIIYAWEKLRRIAENDYNAARSALMDILSNYQAYKKCIVVVVFDAYKVKGNKGSQSKYNNIYVVYTKEAETADMYIEKATREKASIYRIRVATSDNLEQVIILGRGALRISAREFEKEVENIEKLIHSDMDRENSKYKRRLGDIMSKN